MDRNDVIAHRPKSWETCRSDIGCSAWTHGSSSSSAIRMPNCSTSRASPRASSIANDFGHARPPLRGRRRHAGRSADHVPTRADAARASRPSSGSKDLSTPSSCPVAGDAKRRPSDPQTIGPRPPPRPWHPAGRVGLHRRHRSWPPVGCSTDARATTHWGLRGSDWRSRHRGVIVDAGPIYIRDGNVLTAAGVTSALDLTLALHRGGPRVRHGPARGPRAGDVPAATRQPGAGEHVRGPGSARASAGPPSGRPRHEPPRRRSQHRCRADPRAASSGD